MTKPASRPAESLAFLAIAAPVYAWLASVGVPNDIAALAALVVGVLPYVVSELRDGRPEDGDPGDDVVEGPPPASPLEHAENHELTHD